MNRSNEMMTTSQPENARDHMCKGTNNLQVVMLYVKTLIPEICKATVSWWRHQMETFSALLAICAGNSPVTGEFPIQRPVTRSFDVYFDLRPNERLSKQSRGWWFETLSSPLWRHRNVESIMYHHDHGIHDSEDTVENSRQTLTIRWRWEHSKRGQIP